jgi:hypothetical protein
MVKRDEIGLIKEPIKPNNLPNHAQWLAGQGCGSWFILKSIDNSTNYLISRYSPEGELEFCSEFTLQTDREFSCQCPYVFTYISHHKMCTIIQHNHKFEFYNISFL